jgi:hypothetical protein
VSFDTLFGEVEVTKLPQRAFEEASKLLVSEQEALGRLLLDEQASERRWEELYAGSHDLLAALAEQALAEHRTGRTEQLDQGCLRVFRERGYC